MANGGCVDKNQDEIVRIVRAAGISVESLAGVGKGVPDLVIGFRRRNYMVEIKNPDTYYGRSGLNKNQREFAAKWRGGPIHVAYCADDILRIVGLLDEKEKPCEQKK